MKAVLCIVFCCFIASIRSQAATGTAVGFLVASSDNPSAVYPLTMINTVAVAASATDTTKNFIFTSGTDTAPKQTSGGSASAIQASQTANVFTASYKTGTGIPNVQTFTLAQATTTAAAATSVLITLTVGPQVSLTVAGTGTGATAGSYKSSSSLPAVGDVVCGNYYIDCTAGTLMFSMYVAGTAGNTCVVTVTQVQGVFAGLAYATASAPSAANQATILTAVQTAAGTTATSGTKIQCGSTTITGSNTLYLFVVTATAGTAASTLVNSAIVLKTSNTFTSSGSYTLIGGYAVPVLVSNTAGFSAPTSQGKALLFGLGALTDSNSPLTLASSQTVIQANGAQLVFVPTTSTTTPTAQFAVGVPVTTTITLINDQTTTGGINQIFTLSVGTQVSLSVQACATTTASTTACTPTTAGASAQTSALSSGAACGQYYLDCAGGTLQLSFNAAASTASNYQYCVFTLTQVPALFGALSYATAPPSSTYTTLGAAIQTQSGAPNAATICSTQTGSSTTVLYYIDQFASTAATTDLTTAQTKLNAAFKTKTAFALSARLLEEEESFRVLATSYTLTSGYANTLPTAAAAGFTAPSSTSTASLAANASTTTTTTGAQSLSLQIVAVVITSVATLMGLVL